MDPLAPTLPLSNPGTKATTPPSRLLALPMELRLQIWRTYATWPQKPYLRYASEGHDMLETSGDVDSGLLYTCWQIYHEAMPILAANVQLHITYQHHSPLQPNALPPRQLCERIENVFFHCCLDGDIWGDHRPPRAPFGLYRFTRLRTFTMCSPILLNFGDLFETGTEHPITAESYEALSEDAKLAVWDASGLLCPELLIRCIERYGRGSWLSQLARDGGFNLASPNSPDTEDAHVEEDDDGYESDWDSSRTATEEELAKHEKDNQLRGIEIAKKMHIMIEAELDLVPEPISAFDGSEGNRAELQTLLITVDTRHNVILNRRFLGKEEWERRFAESREAS